MRTVSNSFNRQIGYILFKSGKIGCQQISIFFPRFFEMFRRASRSSDKAGLRPGIRRRHNYRIQPCNLYSQTPLFVLLTNNERSLSGHFCIGRLHWRRTLVLYFFWGLASVVGVNPSTPKVGVHRPVAK